jgi:uracil-DNA glycosylase
VEECGFTEIVKCFVGKDRKMLRKCGHRCWSIFERQLRSYDFKLLILLGVQTLNIFNREAGTQLPIGELTTVKVSGAEYYVLPIYHPSPINPNNHPNNRAIFNDFRGKLNVLLSEIS